MQVLIARTLNKILLLFVAVIVILFAGIFVVGYYRPGYRPYYLGVFIFVSLVLALYFKYLEDYWDKGMITRMAKDGKVALMNLRGGRRLMPLRDTSLRTYWIYELEGELWNREHVPIPKTFQEKMHRDTQEIPQGFVYVTYDEQKPRQIGIIPNAIIGNLPLLIPLVEYYEKDRGINVTYLDAYYNQGMVLKTFKETIADYKAGKK
ncbi:MAG: hypothetical protein LBP32_06945 [Spirochaetaceae bacterium]|jgi:hypothetical protein|nr:hypothetical protein [Spirochaetaceae bacterium]